MISRIIIPLLVILSLAAKVHAQEMIPFEFTSEEDNRLIKENDSVKFYVASDDTTNVVCINEDAATYRLLNKDHKLIANGSYILESDKYLQDGKWTEYFANGKIKKVGYYLKGAPVGTWEVFYDNGKPRKISNFAILKDDRGVTSSCLSGSYHEYFKSGLLKTEGFYAATLTTVADSILVEDPVTGRKALSVQKYNSYKPEKIGHWESYDEAAADDKKPEGAKKPQDDKKTEATKKEPEDKKADDNKKDDDSKDAEKDDDDNKKKDDDDK